MNTYIQMINMGLESQRELLEIDEWNVELAIKKISALQNAQEGIKIIGFRFVDKENEMIVNESGIYYIEGEIVEYPVEDMEVYHYFKKRELTVPAFPVIKMKVPFLIVYPFEKNDTLLCWEKIQDEHSEEYRKARIEELRENISQYKEEIIEELSGVLAAIEAEQFSLIPLFGEQKEDGKRYLNINEDKGNFGKHITLLQEYIDELKKLQNEL